MNRFIAIVHLLLLAGVVTAKASQEPPSGQARRARAEGLQSSFDNGPPKGAVYLYRGQVSLIPDAGAQRSDSLETILERELARQARKGLAARQDEPGREVQVRLRFTLAPDGAVSKVGIERLRSTDRPAMIRRILLEWAKGLRLKSVGKRLEFVWEVHMERAANLGVGYAASLSPKLPPLRYAKGLRPPDRSDLRLVGDARPKALQELLKTLHADRTGFQWTVDRAMRQAPNLYGSLELELVLKPEGKVTAVRVVRTLPDSVAPAALRSLVERDLKSHAERLSFPQATGSRTLRWTLHIDKRSKRLM